MKNDSSCHICKKDCFSDSKDYYMLKDQIWQKIHPKKSGMLCMDCAEKKLGRTLKMEDILICPLTVIFNPYTAAILKGDREARRVNQKYKVRMRITWRQKNSLLTL